MTMQCSFQMDKFLSGFGISGMMTSKGGGDNSSTASPVDSRSNSPKPPTSQPSKVCLFKGGEITSK